MSVNNLKFDSTNNQIFSFTNICFFPPIFPSRVASSLASPSMPLLPYVPFTSYCYCHLMQEIKVTQHVAHIGKSEICTKFCQLKAKIAPWKCSMCWRMIIELILILWQRIKCPLYCTKDPQVQWPPLLCMFLAMTSVNFCCHRVKEWYGLDSCG